MADQVRVLVVEDERPLARVVADYLRKATYEVTVVHDGPGAVTAARADDPDVIILDLMLPGLDGIEVCRQIRSFSDAYVVMLTARDEEVDKIVGLSVGADDYMSKPFSPRELVARVQAMLRRPRAGSERPDAPAGLFQLGDLVVDPIARSVSVRGEPIDLTRTEFDLLATMAAHPRAAFSRQQLIEAVWGLGWYGDEHVVDVHIGHLRRKLGDDAGEARFVRTVRGYGYGMVAP